MTNIFDKTVETLINDAEVLTKKYHDLLGNGKTREAIDVLRLLKDTLSLIKEYDWHLEYSEYVTGIHNKVEIWEQNHSGEIRNKKSWNVGNTMMYIDYGTDYTTVYVNRRKFVFDLKTDIDDFINTIKTYSDKNTSIYIDDSGLGAFVGDLLDSNDIIYHKIRNMNNLKE